MNTEQMAKTNSYWFTHDTDAWSDINIELMMSVYGAEGYGFYWIIVETLSMEENYRLPLGNKGYTAVLSRRMQTSPERLSEFIDDCIDSFNLFDSDASFFWSESLIKRLGVRDKTRKTAEIKAMKRWGNLDRFDEFWESYDKKTSKERCQSLWKKMSKDKKENAISYIDGYKKAQPDKKYRKNPDTYLRNESWNDEVISSSSVPSEEKYENVTKEDYDKLFKG
jgi:hypothetical protein